VSQPPPPGAPPPGPPPYGGPPQYPTTPAYATPPPVPPRRGVSGGIIAAIVGGVGLLVAGAVVFLVFFRGGDEPPLPPPPPPPPVSPISPTPGPTPEETESPTEEEIPDEPESVTLADALERQVGRFLLVDVQPHPQVIAELGAVDAVQAVYSRADNTRVLHFLQVYQTNFDADRVRNGWVQFFKGEGFRSVFEGRQRGIRVSRLQGSTEIVVWSNGRLVAILEGPFDITTGFFLALPY
jgi:hypothetical protein